MQNVRCNQNRIQLCMDLLIHVVLKICTHLKTMVQSYFAKITSEGWYVCVLHLQLHLDLLGHWYSLVAFLWLPGSKRHRDVRRANRMIRRIIYLPFGCRSLANPDDLHTNQQCLPESRLFLSKFLPKFEVWILLQERDPLLHWESYVNSFMDIPSDGGMVQKQKVLNTPWHGYFFHITGLSDLQPCFCAGHAEATQVQIDQCPAGCLRGIQRDALLQQGLIQDFDPCWHLTRRNRSKWKPLGKIKSLFPFRTRPQYFEYHPK